MADVVKCVVVGRPVRRQNIRRSLDPEPRREDEGQRRNSHKCIRSNKRCAECVQGETCIGKSTDDLYVHQFDNQYGDCYCASCWVSFTKDDAKNRLFVKPITAYKSTTIPVLRTYAHSSRTKLCLCHFLESKSIQICKQYDAPSS